jgi:16S rRNA (guanine966-N2)-methyltransferase
MRIIGGSLRSRKLNTPKDDSATRPLPDRVREAIFNMLGADHVEGRVVVDAFAGTGSFGIEALSRGADRAVFIERDKDAAALLARNLHELELEDRSDLTKADVLSPAAFASVPRPVHLALFDPPYPMMQDPPVRDRILRRFVDVVALLDPEGFAILRTPWPFRDRIPKPDDPERFDLVEVALELDGAYGPETHVYGSTAIHLYMHPDNDPDTEASRA